MRSSRGNVDQLLLWTDEVPAAPAKSRSGRVRERPDRTVVVAGDDFASRGWLAGTVLHHAPAVRAGRGDLTVVREGDDLLVGFWGLDVGRPALFTDRGSVWLGESARVVGVVTAVEPPFLFQ